MQYLICSRGLCGLCHPEKCIHPQKNVKSGQNSPSVSTSPKVLVRSGARIFKIFIQCFPQIPGRASQMHFWQSVAARMSLMQVWISWIELRWLQSSIASEDDHDDHDEDEDEDDDDDNDDD